MRNGSWLAVARMVVGSALGVLGFGTLSLGFMDLRGVTLAVGTAEVLVGTFLALGVLVPLRRASATSRAP